MSSFKRYLSSASEPDMKGKGPSAAFDLLESKLSSLKGRKFYGTFQPKPDGEEYYTCVVRIDSNNPGKM